MKISIIGAGALGKTYGGLLALSGQDVNFLMHSEYPQIKEAGCFYLNFSETQERCTVQAPHSYNHALELPPSDLIVISLKTTENDKLSSLLSACLTEKSVILIIQNGIGNEEFISRLTGDCPIICAISSMGASRSDAVNVQVSYAGALKLAPFRSNAIMACSQIQNLFGNLPVSIPIKIYEHYKELRWHKLAWNVPFGALSIIFDKTTDVLSKDEPYLTIVRHLISEITDIARSEGVTFQNLNPQDWISFTQKTQGYYPSIYRDLKEGKALEKEYIFDNVLKIAKKNNIVAPYLSLCTQFLNFI